MDHHLKAFGAEESERVLLRKNERYEEALMLIRDAQCNKHLLQGCMFPDIDPTAIASQALRDEPAKP